MYLYCASSLSSREWGAARHSQLPSKLVNITSHIPGQSLVILRENVAASNFPHHRGSATAFPLASFGLSAFFFSTVSTLAFRDDTGRFLLVLAVGTSCLVFVSSFFLQILPSSSSYSSIPDQEFGNESEEGLLRRSKSAEHRRSSSGEIGTHDATSSITAQRSSLSYTQDQAQSTAPGINAPDTKVDETSSLIPEDGVCDYDNDLKSNGASDSLLADVRGFSMVPTLEFWQRFLLLGMLTGIGLMTIK